MFELFYNDPDSITRYRAAPLLEERLRFLEHCAAAGYSVSALRRIGTHQMYLIQLLDLREGERGSVARIEAAAQELSRPGVRRSRRPAGRKARVHFIGHAVRWMRFAGLLEEPEPDRHAHADEVAAFVAWMRDERGLADATIKHRRETIDPFFHGLDGRGIGLASIRIAEIDEAIASYHARGCSRSTVHFHAQNLRAFFRFAEHRSWCGAELADGIMPLRRYSGETIPKGLNRDEVIRLLATTEGDRPADIRDRAILMLLITYGLRAGEVRGLQTEDMHSRENMLRVRRPKPGRTHLYPLSQGVRETVTRYLSEVRPEHPDRRIFLTLNAPFRPVSGKALFPVVRDRLDRLGVIGKHRGPHALRHATAQHLLDHGLPMKTAGDYLGHRSIVSTAVYARVRLGALREVAEIDLESLA